MVCRVGVEHRFWGILIKMWLVRKTGNGCIELCVMLMIWDFIAAKGYGGF